MAYGYQSCCCAQDEAILAADPASVEEARSLLAEAPELAETQGVPMLGLRIAASEARLDQRLDAWGEVARRLDLALRRMVEKLRLRRSPRCARTSRTDPAEDESGDLARFHPIGVGAAIGRWKGWRLLLGAYVSYWHKPESAESSAIRSLPGDNRTFRNAGAQHCNSATPQQLTQIARRCSTFTTPGFGPRRRRVLAALFGPLHLARGDFG